LRGMSFRLCASLSHYRNYKHRSYSSKSMNSTSRSFCPVIFLLHINTGALNMHPQAGQLVPRNMLISIPKLVSAYYTEQPDLENPRQTVHFGTSGHRGSSLTSSFNEVHILAICQAVCDYRKTRAISGPLFLGMDTHALSESAFITAIEVLAANNINVFYQEKRGYTPTPVISHAIINFNHTSINKADGLILTPSHNPPEDGGIKYNPPHGGPAENTITTWIAQRANSLMTNELKEVHRIPFERAIKQSYIQAYDYIQPYVTDLENVLNMEAIQHAGLNIGVDPLGGAGLAFWEPIAEAYRLNIDIVNTRIDPRFSFMTLDQDGKVRMDCSSPWAMQSLIHLKDTFDLAIGNDPDFDRHGIVTPQGLMNANDYLAVGADYLYQHRKGWPSTGQIGKTIVTTSLLDRIAQDQSLGIYETPVGFKWYEQGLSSHSISFACEESAGMTFLRKNGSVWTTDKDGFIAGLLAAEIMAVTNKDPANYYDILANKYGRPYYSRTQIASSHQQNKQLSQSLHPEMVSINRLSNEPIQKFITHAAGNQKSIGGLKISTASGWITVRPSGTEPAYKIYAESFKNLQHLEDLQKEAQALVERIVDTAVEAQKA